MRRPEIAQVWTVREIVNWGREYFSSKGIDEAHLTIELMVCAVLSVRRLDLYIDHERPLAKDELARLREMVQRSVRHEPLQYILGTADFYGRAFTVTSEVLIPRPETEILAERVIRHMRSQEARYRCLDIGTGSGVIPITIAAEVAEAEWTAIDSSAGALAVAHANALRHGVADRVLLLEADFFETLPAGGSWDVVTMNPPYIAEQAMGELEPEVREFEPASALTDTSDGLTFYRRFAEVFSDLLVPGGTAFLEFGYGQAEDVCSIIRAVSDSIQVIEDFARIPRLLVVRRK